MSICFGVIIAGALSFSLAGAQTVVQTYVFTRDLTVGSTGPDVITLQKFLNTRGYVVATAGAGSPGMETSYFGPLTRSAVSRYQAANGIMPTAGYFGPITRARVNAAVAVVTNPPTTNNPPSTNNPPTLSGGDGDFQDFNILGSPSNEDVHEGEEVEVFGFEFDADDSDLMVERLDVQVAGDGNTEKPWRYLESLILFNDDDEVATVDASDEDNWDEQDDDEYEITFEGIDEIIEEGDTARFYIAVEANDSIDSSDLPVDFNIFLSNDGIRALNAEGINVYEGDEDDTKSFTIEEAEEGSLDITVRSADNEDRVVEVSEDDDTDDIEIYHAELESQDGENTIEEVTVSLATTTGTTNGLSDFANTLHLYIDGEEVGSESVNSDSATESITFDDIDVTLDDDEEVDLVVTVDVNSQEDNFAANAGMYVSGISIDFVDQNDDDQTVSDTSDGGDIMFGATGINATLNGTPEADVQYGQYSGDNDRGTFTISFKVTAFGDEDIYIGGEGTTDESNAGINYTLTNSGAVNVTQAELTSTADDGDNGTFVINSGDTETFTFTVEVQDSDPGAADTAQRLEITGIKWDTDDDATPDNTYTENLDDFETPSRTI